MSKPTVLSPWFVVVRMELGDTADDVLTSMYQCKWYTAPEDEDDVFVGDRKRAMLFNSIHSAHRIARASNGYVVAVVDEEDLKEYR